MALINAALWSAVNLKSAGNYINYRIRGIVFAAKVNRYNNLAQWLTVVLSIVNNFRVLFLIKQ